MESSTTLHQGTPEKRSAAGVLGDPSARAALYPLLDPSEAGEVLGKVAPLPAFARVRLRAGAELPSLDKKTAGDLARLLQASS